MGDRLLTALLMRSVDGILVHTSGERDALANLTSRPISVAALPPHLPAGTRASRQAGDPPVRRLLFFGKVRHYKGVDILLSALVHVPEDRGSGTADDPGARRSTKLRPAWPTDS